MATGKGEFIIIQSKTINSTSYIRIPVADLVDGLTSYWRFNRAENTTSRDSFGSNNGTIHGKTLNHATVNGALTVKSGDMIFNGNNTSLTIPNNSSIQITGDQTIAMWVYPTNISVARQNPYNKAYGGEGTITQEPSGKLTYYYGTSGADSSPNQSCGSSGSVIENQWNHICVVRDLTNMKIYWYINGSLDSEFTADYASATESTSDLLLGDGYTNHYYGRINNILEYNAALSATQVKQLATQQPRNSYTPITDNLVLQLNGLDYAGTASAPTTIYDSNFLVYSPIEGNSAMVFDGTDDYVNTGINSYLFADSGETWSVSAWFKTSETTDGTIIGRSGVWGTSATFVLGVDGSGNLKIILRGSTNGTTTIANNVDDDEWHHVVVAWDGTTGYGYYDNGSAVTLNVDTATEQGFDILIGATKSDIPSNYFKGEIDEVGVWYKALTANEVTMLYQTSSHAAQKAYYKVIITDDESVIHTICDTYSGTSANNYMISGSVTRPLTNKLGDCSFKISNLNGNFSGVFDGGELIQVYADGVDASTPIWAGRVDNVRYGFSDRDGYFVDIEGRTYPQLVDTLLSEVFVSSKADYCLTKIISDYYPDLDFTFWENGSWVGASYNSTTDSVDWDSTVTTFPTSLLNTTYQHKKGVDAFTQICEQAGLVYYIDYNSGWKLRVFLKDSINYPFASITYGENLIKVGGFGKNNDDVFNKITVYGEQESSNIIMVDTAEDSANQSDLWVKHKVLNESSLTDMTDVEEKADYELSVSTSGVTQEGNVDVLFIDSVKPGYTISANVLGCNLVGSYSIKNLTYDLGSGITLRMDLARLPKTMGDLFIPKINPDDFLSGVNNPNDMLWSLTVSFDESPSLVNCDDYSYEYGGKLRFSPYLPNSSDGTVISDIITADNNVTECEFRVYADYYTIDDEYQVTNNGGETWEDYNMESGVHKFSSTGNKVGFRIIPNRVEYPSNWDIHNITKIPGNELDLSSLDPVTGLRFNLYGTKLFLNLWEDANNKIISYSYTLSVPYDLSTAIQDPEQWSTISANRHKVKGFYMSPDGKYMFGAMPAINRILRIALPNPWDFPGSLPPGYASYLSFKPNPQGIWLNDAGTICYELSGNDNTIYQYNVATPWNLNDKTYNGKSYTLPVPGTNYIWFNSTCTRFLTLDNYFISQFEVSSPIDISQTKFFNLRLQHNGEGLYVLDTLEHDTTYGMGNSLVKIDSTHFILAYTGTDNHGFIKTFSIDGSYNITQIDSLEHDINQGGHNSLVMIDSTHFVLAYTGTDNHGFIKTFSIDDSYNITQIDSLEHDVTQGGHNSLVKIDATHFILAYAGNGDDGYIKTFSIDGSYNITQIDSLEHDTTQGNFNSLAMIDSTHFILAYRGTDNDGFIKTFSIDGSYNISQIDSLEHDTGYAADNSLVKLDSTHFMLAYSSDVNYYAGMVKTFSIDGSYNVSQIDSLNHCSGMGYDNSLVNIDGTKVALAYVNSANTGQIKTFQMDTNYNIIQLDDLNHDTSYARDNSLVMIDSSHFLLAYCGTDSDGYIKTFNTTLATGYTEKFNSFAIADNGTKLLGYNEDTKIAKVYQIYGAENRGGTYDAVCLLYK